MRIASPRLEFFEERDLVELAGPGSGVAKDVQAIRHVNAADNVATRVLPRHFVSLWMVDRRIGQRAQIPRHDGIGVESPCLLGIAWRTVT